MKRKYEQTKRLEQYMSDRIDDSRICQGIITKDPSIGTTTSINGENQLVWRIGISGHEVKFKSYIEESRYRYDQVELEKATKNVMDEIIGAFDGSDYYGHLPSCASDDDHACIYCSRCDINFMDFNNVPDNIDEALKYIHGAITVGDVKWL